MSVPSHAVGSPPPGAADLDASSSPGSAEVLWVVPWSDPVVDPLGHDPRSWYVEQFWLPVLGPTSTWLMRRMATNFDTRPGGFQLETEETARALGLGGRSGRHSPFRRALQRCVTFGIARHGGPGQVQVRRQLFPLPRRHLLRLPVSSQALHRRWTDAAGPGGGPELLRRRARRLALGLLEGGERPEDVEIQLARWRIHPAMAHAATRWAEDAWRTADAAIGARTSCDAPATFAADASDPAEERCTS